MYANMYCVADVVYIAHFAQGIWGSVYEHLKYSTYAELYTPKWEDM